MSFATDLLAFVNDEISLDPGHVAEASTDLLLTGLVDSLGVVQIVGWIEDEVGISIDPADVVLHNFQTVDQMIAYVQRRQVA